MSITRTYNIRSLIVTWGPIWFTGFGDDVIEVSKNEDTWIEKVGADGVMIRALNLNDSGSAKVVLSAGSICNDLVSAQAALDKATGLGRAPFMVKDLNGSTLVHATSAWLKKDPVLAYGKEAGDREYTFTLHPMDQFTGGLVL